MGTTTYDFSNGTVLVSGANSGIGRAIARRFGSVGATVLVGDIREDPKRSNATPTHELIREGGGKVEFVEVDVGKPDEVYEFVEAAHDFEGST